MNSPIKTAADLHRELTKRGLQLQPEVGRDATLVAQVAKEIGIPPGRFMTNLKASGKTAEDYLRALMLVGAPFAQMFREVWAYLSRHCAPKAHESLVIRFGFGGDNKDVDWDQFRLMAESVKKVRTFGPVLLWKDEHLFNLGRILSRNLKARRHPHYQVGADFQLEVIEGTTPADEVGSTAREILQSLIDEIHAAWPGLEAQEQQAKAWEEEEEGFENVRDLPELDRRGAESDPPARRERTARQLAYLLADLVPTWGDVCAQWELIPASDKREAEHYFREMVEPFLKSAQAYRWRRIQEALDLLELPFWRYRWHTYEVWASIKALEALAEFHPQPVIKDGHIALDAAIPAVIATFDAEPLIYAHVQGETKLEKPLGRRKAIKPDLRFSIDDPATNAGTVTIVEFKQRAELESAHVSEVLAAYSLGAGLGGGVIVINYDAVPNVTVPPGCSLFGDVHPGNPDNVRDYQQAVRERFSRLNVVPLDGKQFVLLDVSSSMDSEYSSAAAQRGLKRLAALPWVKVYRFNDGLEAGGDLRSNVSICTRGGTQLGAALEQLFTMPDAGLPKRLLIVTDGGHDHPDELLGRCGSVLECTPDELENKLEWLNERLS